jgi:hypothetical protein
MNNENTRETSHLANLSRPRSRLDAYVSVFLLVLWKNTLFNE